MNTTVNYHIAANKTILQLMRKANESIKYPKIRLNGGYVLSLAGNKSKYKGSINITDGQPYGANIWYGRINTNGKLTYPRFLSEDSKDLLEDELIEFSKDPAKYATLYGKLHSSCMFCGKELTNQQSIAVGYGPICAGKYGLPHGELSKVDAYEGSHAQIDMLDLTDHEATMNDIKPDESERISMAAYSGISTCCEEMLTDKQYAELYKELEKHTDNVEVKYHMMVDALVEYTL